MTLSQMPMHGKWEKIREEWNEISEGLTEISRIRNLTERQIIDEICRKRYNSSRRKYFEVPKQKYHSHTKLREELNLLCEEFSDITSLYSIGQTVEGRDILCVKISEGVHTERSLLKPQVKYVGGIHGDEVVGRELLLYLARALCEQHGLDSGVTSLLHTTEVHILPSLHVDCYILKTRYISYLLRKIFVRICLLGLT